MKNLTLFAVSASLAITSQAQAEDVQYARAKVIESKPIVRIVEQTSYRQECRPQVRRSNHSANNSGGRILGSIIGAAIGHKIGKKSRHRTGATVAGAIIGGSIGNDVSRDNNHSYEQHNACYMKPVTWQEERIIGYQVVYRYNGQTFESRMPYDPGKRIRVQISVSPVIDSERSDYTEDDYSQQYEYENQ